MKVLVTDPIADAGLTRLREAGHDVETAYEVEGDALLDAVADANALIVRSGTEVTEEVFAAASDLIIVGRAGIGVDNIDIDAATDHGVIVANAPEATSVPPRNTLSRWRLPPPAPFRRPTTA